MTKFIISAEHNSETFEAFTMELPGEMTAEIWSLYQNNIKGLLEQVAKNPLIADTVKPVLEAPEQAPEEVPAPVEIEETSVVGA